MVRNNDGTGSLKIVQPLDYEDQLQSNGFRFRIQVNDKVSICTDVNPIAFVSANWAFMDYNGIPFSAGRR